MMGGGSNVGRLAFQAAGQILWICRQIGDIQRGRGNAKCKMQNAECKMMGESVGVVRIRMGAGVEADCTAHLISQNRFQRTDFDSFSSRRSLWRAIGDRPYVGGVNAK